MKRSVKLWVITIIAVAMFALIACKSATGVAEIISGDDTGVSEVVSEENSTSEEIISEGSASP